MGQVRRPAVAGLFYPAEPAALTATLERCMDQRVAGAAPSQVMVVPHAGLPYSGPVAASAYGALEGVDRPTRVSLLGPPHRLPVVGVAASSASAFETPLGRLRVAYPESLRGMPGIIVDDDAHLEEHSLEVQLPFLQRLWGNDLTIAPLLVGEASPAMVDRIIEALLEEPGALVLVSSDLSHYQRYETARRIDAETIAALESATGSLTPDQACGCRALNGLIEFCRRNDTRLQALDVRNSGDTAGSHDRVVGYAALALR